MGAQKSEVNFVTSIRKEHRVVMSFAYTPADFRRALDLLIAGEIDLTPWTVKLRLEDGQRAFERMTMIPAPHSRWCWGRELVLALGEVQRYLPAGIGIGTGCWNATVILLLVNTPPSIEES